MRHDVPLLLTELRAHTRAEHAHIESVLRLTDPMSLRRYAAIVAGLHEFLSRWEPRLAQALPEHLRGWCEARRRRDFTADDLRHLDTTASDATREAAREAVEALPLGDAASAFGSMYVIEGSALGGQVITPLLRDHLGLRPTQGASYFHGHGPSTGAMWQEFRGVITRELEATDAVVRQACGSARATFTALASVFKGLPA